MNEERRLLCVLARPGEESVEVGGTLVRYAAEGVATYLLVATRGERSWPGYEREHPGPECLGQLHEAELRAAAAVLGVRGVDFLDYREGELGGADRDEAIGRIVAQLRRTRPQVVVTHDPDGEGGHPDRLAVGRLATAAVARAADPGDGREAPHRVARLYYLVESPARLAAYGALFGAAWARADGRAPAGDGRGDPAITTRLATAAHWQRVRQAVGCHQTQLADYRTLGRLPPERHQSLWGEQEFRLAAASTAPVRGGRDGRAIDLDLFAGLP